MFNFDGMVNALPRQNANDDVSILNIFTKLKYNCILVTSNMKNLCAIDYCIYILIL